MSKHFDSHSLCILHDRYMETYDALIDTEWYWMLTANYTELVKLSNISNDSIKIHALTLIIYKQNVYAIDEANTNRK